MTKKQEERLVAAVESLAHMVKVIANSSFFIAVGLALIFLLIGIYVLPRTR